MLCLKYIKRARQFFVDTEQGRYRITRRQAIEQAGLENVINLERTTCRVHADVGTLYFTPKDTPKEREQ